MYRWLYIIRAAATPGGKGGFCNVNSVNVDHMMLFISGAALLLLNSVNDRWTVGDSQINTVNRISKERKLTAGKSVSASKHGKNFQELM